MSSPELERRLREVRAYWHNKARSDTNVGQVCKAFLRADEKLRSEHGSAMHDPTWWRRRADDRTRSRAAAVGPLLHRIRTDTGLSSLGAGLLTALPVLCFGAMAPLAPILARRFGTSRTLARCLRGRGLRRSTP